MSYFNSDQQDYMRYLCSLPRDARCLCGWYKKGECSNRECEANHEAELARREKESREALAERGR
jgi:hypothetical protein